MIAYSNKYVSQYNKSKFEIYKVNYSKYSNRYRSYKVSGNLKDLKP